MPRAVAINVAANTTLPGFRGPIFPDGRFTYVPIPEREPTGEEVVTYGDLLPELDLPESVLDHHLDDLADTPVHLDPAFEGYPYCSTHTYGDEHGVKARPISDLEAGDYLFFYATLTTTGTPERDWIVPEWGAYLIGAHRLAEPPVTGEQWPDLTAPARERYRENAHVKREQMDARVLVAGDPGESGLFDRAVPLSSTAGGSTANGVVTELAGDSGKGPWWRRVLRFDETATERLLALRDQPGDAQRVR